MIIVGAAWAIARFKDRVFAALSRRLLACPLPDPAVAAALGTSPMTHPLQGQDQGGLLKLLATLSGALNWVIWIAAVVSVGGGEGGGVTASSPPPARPPRSLTQPALPPPSPPPLPPFPPQALTLDNIGFNLRPLLATVGGASVVVGLAAQSLLQHMAAGLTLVGGRGGRVWGGVGWGGGGGVAAQSLLQHMAAGLTLV